MNCKVCGATIPERRVKLGYKDTCVNHSTQQKYTGIVSAVGKTDYEVVIVKDPEVARHLVSLSNTYGGKTSKVESYY
jgi:hypothetical protein